MSVGIYNNAFRDEDGDLHTIYCFQRAEDAGTPPVVPAYAVSGVPSPSSWFEHIVLDGNVYEIKDSTDIVVNAGYFRDDLLAFGDKPWKNDNLTLPQLQEYCWEGKAEQYLDDLGIDALVPFTDSEEYLFTSGDEGYRAYRPTSVVLCYGFMGAPEGVEGPTHFLTGESIPDSPDFDYHQHIPWLKADYRWIGALTNDL